MVSTEGVGRLAREDGSVLIKVKSDDSEFKSGLSKLGNVAKTGLKAGVAAISGIATAAAGAVTGLLAIEQATEEYRVAMGKLNTAFQAANMSQEAAKQSYTEFYKILGDTDTATEASQLLAKLADSEEDIANWTDIAAGVYGTFGDSLPIEGLIEAANETVKVGTVTGVLADALNWAGISEDEFNEKLAACSSESERNQLLMDTLSRTYQGAADAFYQNNEALIQARENQALMDETLAKLGETVSTVKNQILADFLPAISDIVTAFSDMVSGVEGADTALATAVENMVNAAVEKLPEFLNFGLEIIKAVVSGIADNLPTLLEGAVQILAELGAAIIELLPTLGEAATSILEYLANALNNDLPVFLENLPDLVQGVLDSITENLPAVLEKGVEILSSLIQGIIGAIPDLIAALPDIIVSITEFIAENLPAILEAGVQIIGALVEGLFYAIPELIAAIPEIGLAITEGLWNLIDVAVEIGTALVEGIAEGITGAAGWLMEQIGDFIDWVIDGIKGFLGIGSGGGGSGGGGSSGRSGSSRAATARAAAMPAPAPTDGPAGGTPVSVAAEDGGSLSARSLTAGRSRVLQAMQASMPAMEQRVAAATAAMAPASAYYDPFAAHRAASQAGQPEQGQSAAPQRFQLDIEFKPREAARFLKPHIDEETNRKGESLARGG